MDKPTQIYNEALREAREQHGDDVLACRKLIARLKALGFIDTYLIAKIKDRLSWLRPHHTQGCQAWLEVECELDHLLSINA